MSNTILRYHLTLRSLLAKVLQVFDRVPNPVNHRRLILSNCLCLASDSSISNVPPFWNFTKGPVAENTIPMLSTIFKLSSRSNKPRTPCGNALIRSTKKTYWMPLRHILPFGNVDDNWTP